MNHHKMRATAGANSGVNRGLDTGGRGSRLQHALDDVEFCDRRRAGRSAIKAPRESASQARDEEEDDEDQKADDESDDLDLAEEIFEFAHGGHVLQRSFVRDPDACRTRSAVSGDPAPGLDRRTPDPDTIASHVC